MGGKGTFAFALALCVLSPIAIAGCGGDSPSSGAEQPGPGGSATTGSSADPSSHPGEPSADFRTPGGDNSIQTYGGEAGAGERRDASAALEAYMTARGDQDWEAACVELSPVAIEPMERLLGPGSGCPATMAAIAKRLSPSTWADTMTGPIAALRREGDQGFALYHGSGGTDYFIQMSGEGGEWKVAALEPTAFP